MQHSCLMPISPAHHHASLPSEHRGNSVTPMQGVEDKAHLACTSTCITSVRAHVKKLGFRFDVIFGLDLTISPAHQYASLDVSLT